LFFDERERVASKKHKKDVIREEEETPFQFALYLSSSRYSSGRRRRRRHPHGGRRLDRVGVREIPPAFIKKEAAFLKPPSAPWRLKRRRRRRRSSSS